MSEPERRTTDVFVKRRPDAPPGFFEAEAAGLRWLGEATAHGGVPVVRPLEVHADRIVLPRLATTGPDAAAAETFGRRLAATHAAGAAGFGAPPDGFPADGWIGDAPLPHAVDAATRPTTWGPFYAAYRLQPYARAAYDAGALSPSGRRAVDAVCDRLAADDEELTGPPEPPARLHGDLWSGNVVWTPDGAVLVDPAAHGGHRETDLAMLELFGLRGIDRVLAGYDEAAPLADGRSGRVGLHQLHPLLVHAVLFGAGYGAQAEAIARRHA